MITETLSYIFRWRSCCHRRCVCVNSLMYLGVFAGACASSLEWSNQFAENWYEQLKYRSKLQAVKDLKLKKLHTTQTLNFLTRHVHVQMQNTYCSNHCIVCLCKTNSDTITYCYSVKPIMYCRKETTKFFQKRRVSSQTQEKSWREANSVITVK